MPVQIGTGSVGDNVAAGVYPANLLFVDEELHTFDWSPQPRAFVKFELPALQKTATLSIEVTGLPRLVRILTGGRSMNGGQDASGLHQQAISLLKGAKWTGLVRVGNRGFVDQVQLPQGPYVFRYLGITTRDRQSGRPASIEYNNAQGEKRQFLRYLSEVVEGKYLGYTHDDSIPVSLSVRSGDLVLSDKSALFVWLQALGVSGTFSDFDGVQFVDTAEAIELFDRTLLKHGQAGHRYAGVINQDYRCQWQALVAMPKGEITQGQRSEMAAVVVQAFDLIGKTVFGQMTGGLPTVIVDTAGRLSDPHGVFLGKNLLRIVSTALPDSGIPAKWPPSSWSEESLVQAIAIFGEIAGWDQNQMMLCIGDQAPAHSALAAFLQSKYALPADAPEQPF
jgi:hypothetical protein